MATQEAAKLITAAFPIQPVPGKFWVDADNRPRPGDIPEELATRIAHRPWGDVTVSDWKMVGAPACTARLFIDPDAFRYYLPSLMVGALGDFGYIDWPLECLFPAEGPRRIANPWWKTFADGFVEPQKDAVRAYLASAQPMLREGSADMRYLDQARLIWEPEIGV